MRVKGVQPSSDLRTLDVLLEDDPTLLDAPQTSGPFRLIAPSDAPDGTEDAGNAHTRASGLSKRRQSTEAVNGRSSKARKGSTGRLSPVPAFRLIAPHGGVDVATVAAQKSLEQTERQKQRSHHGGGGNARMSMLTGNKAELGGKLRRGRSLLDGSSGALSEDDMLAGVSDAILTWHPGMTSAYGITYVDTVKSATAAPLPTLLTDQPERWAAMPPRPVDVQVFPEEPLAAGLQYLRYLAVSAGRLPQFPARLQQSFNLEQRLYRERLVRILLARDGRHLEKQRTQGTRRSTRARFAPDVFIPTVVGSGGGGEVRTGRAEKIASPEADYARADLDPASQTDTRLGEEFQCELPQPRRRPAAPTAEENVWLDGVVLEPGSAPPPPPSGLRAQQLRDAPPDERVMAVTSASAALSTALGPDAAAALGMGTMGATMASSLDAAQQVALGEGMEECGRDFPSIVKQHVPGVPARQLAAYYYDVWKLRAVPAAVAWYQRRAEEAEAEAAEAVQVERQRVEDAARRAERAEASNRRRQVKEAVGWVRGAAKAPKEVNFNKPVVRERALRTAKALCIASAALALAQAEEPT